MKFAFVHQFQVICTLATAIEKSFKKLIVKSSETNTEFFDCDHTMTMLFREKTTKTIDCLAIGRNNG